jgi:hypothetical protein
MKPANLLKSISPGVARWILPACCLSVAVPAKAEPTFTRDVAPIIFKNCTPCHRPGEIAPFPLVSYLDVKKRARQLRDVTHDRIMPPWKAEPGWGEFLDARGLTTNEIALIARWVEQGAVEGKTADLPALPKFTDGWQLGTPDLVLKTPEPYNVPAEGRDDYRCFVIPVNLPTDKYVKAIEFRPGNRRIVHHAIFYLDSSGEARRLDAESPGPGYTHFGGPGFPPTGGLGGWAPGVTPRSLPEGVARSLRKGSDLVVQVHFHPSGKPEVEQSSIGLYFAKEAPKKILLPITLGTRQIDIPAGEKDYRVHDSFTLPAEMQIVGIIPHAHYLGKEMKATATLPDGSLKPLLWIKQWDFNWQEQYRYAEPFLLPAGTKIEMDFSYDNSADNPNNPSTPPQRVRFGEQTTNEMAFLWLQAVPQKLSDLAAIARAFAERRKLGGAALFAGGGRQEILELLARRFDADGDGKISDAERAEAKKQLGFDVPAPKP